MSFSLTIPPSTFIRLQIMSSLYIAIQFDDTLRYNKPEEEACKSSKGGVITVRHSSQAMRSYKAFKVMDASLRTFSNCLYLEHVWCEVFVNVNHLFWEIYFKVPLCKIMKYLQLDFKIQSILTKYLAQNQARFLEDYETAK